MSDLPPEPPIGSIVSDRNGDKWDRRNDGYWYWSAAGGSGFGHPWVDIAPSTAVGPLTVLREGPAS